MKLSKINTFLIGVQKAGTSTFWNWLTQHPDVYGPAVMKDFHFFSQPIWRNKGQEYLHSFYKNYNGQKIILHGGVNYYFEPEIFKYIMEYQPDGKYIIILRDPVERAWSAYQYFSKLGQEKRLFSQAIMDELKGNNSLEDRHMYAYLEHGLYSKYLRKILERIDAKQLLVLDYNSLFEFPTEKMSETFSFLGIAPDVEVDITIKKNKTGQVRFQWLNEIVYSKKGIIGKIKSAIPVQKLIPFSWRIRLGNIMRDVNVRPHSDKPKIADDQRIFLTEFFRDDQEDLSHLLEEYWDIKL